MKNYIKNKTIEMIESYEDRINELNILLPIIDIMDFDKAIYNIYVTSRWHNEGEQNSKTKCIGNLDDAIKKAVSDFRKLNKRSDWQADIQSVQIKVANEVFNVPEKMWKKLEKKYTK